MTSIHFEVLNTLKFLLKIENVAKVKLGLLFSMLRKDYAKA